MTAPARAPVSTLFARARFFVGLIALMATLSGITLCALAFVPPAITSLAATTVGSNSMAPSLNEGDVVHVKTDVPPDLAAPTVVLVDRSGGAPLLHRIVEQRPNGDYVTKGDANERADSDTVARSRILGVGTLVVPWVGLPWVWLQDGKWLQLGLFLLITTVVLRFARYGWSYEHDPWLAGARDTEDTEDTENTEGAAGPSPDPSSGAGSVAAPDPATSVSAA